MFTADAHPTNHVSFYINHANDPKAEPFKPYLLPNGMTQVLWPVHCVKGTWGWQLHSDLIKDPHDVIVEKGTEVDQEFYSAFICVDGVHRTNLSSILKSYGITHVATCGLVYEYCVGGSACDSASEGFVTSLISDATRGLTKEGMDDMTTKLKAAGVNIIATKQLEEYGYKVKPSSIHSSSAIMNPLSPTNSTLRYQLPQFSSASSPHRPVNIVAPDHSVPSLSLTSSFSSSSPPPLLSSSLSLTSMITTANCSPNVSRQASLVNPSMSSSSSSLSSSVLAGNGALDPLRRPKILLGLSGSVASIKVTELLQLLCSWADVRIICTSRSKHFFSVEAIRQQFGVTVYQDEDEWDKPWKRGDSVLHVDVRHLNCWHTESLSTALRIVSNISFVVHFFLSIFSIFQLRRWADLMIVAPLSANTLAKIANGLCDNLLVS